DQQDADRSDPAVAEVVNVIHDADALAQLQQVADGGVEIFRIQRAGVEIVATVILLIELDVELQAAHAAEVILARVKEHAMEERSRGIKRRRIAGAQLAVDLDE